MPATETAGAFAAKPTTPGWSPVRNRHREPRKTPGFQRLDRRTRRHPDWLTEGSVSSKPVSGQIPSADHRRSIPGGRIVEGSNRGRETTDSSSPAFKFEPLPCSLTLVDVRGVPSRAAATTSAALSCRRFYVRHRILHDPF